MRNPGKELNSSKRMVSGALSLTLSVIIVKLIGFLYKVPLSRILGDEGMGYFNSAYTVFTFFYMLCSGGIPKAVSILVTEMDVSGKRENANKILSISLKIFLAIGIAFSLCLMLLSKNFASLIENDLSAFSLFCIAPSLAFVSASGVLRGYLNGKRKLISVAVSEVLDGCIKFVFGLTLSYIAYRKNYAPAVISAFTVLGVTIGSFVAALFLYISAKIVKSDENTGQNSEGSISTGEIIRGILRISLPITLSSAVLGASNMIDLGMLIRRLVASGVGHADAVALYGNYTTLAVPMLNLVGALITPMATSALPELTGLYTLGMRDGFVALEKRLIGICAWFALPMSFAFIMFPEEILCLIFDDASAKVAARLLCLLAPSVVFLPMLTIANTALEAAEKTKLPLLSMSIGIVFKLAAGYVLIGNPDVGIAGAPIGTTLCYAVSLFISLIFVSRYLGIRLPMFSLLIKPALVSFISVGCAKLLYDTVCTSQFNAAKFILSAVAAALLYVIISALISRKELIGVIDFIKIHKKSKATL